MFDADVALCADLRGAGSPRCFIAHRAFMKLLYWHIGAVSGTHGRRQREADADDR